MTTISDTDARGVQAYLDASSALDAAGVPITSDALTLADRIRLLAAERDGATRDALEICAVGEKLVDALKEIVAKLDGKQVPYKPAQGVASIECLQHIAVANDAIGQSYAIAARAILDADGAL